MKKSFATSCIIMLSIAMMSSGNAFAWNLLGAGFYAPSYSGVPSNPENGAIIYDTNANVFKGYSPVVGWTTMSGAPAVAPVGPIVQKFTSGSGTFNKSYVFTITSGSATVGATYTNNSITFTVSNTVTSATQVIMTGGGAPVSSGTLTKTSGTGDATLTFQVVRAPIYLRVKMVGGGGGGAAGGPSGTSGSDGTDTTFGTTLLVAGKGTGGSNTGNGGAGGSASLGTGPTGVAVIGSPGTGNGTSETNIYQAGGMGGSSPYFGGGGGGQTSANGVSGVANTGGGGGGGSSSLTLYSPAGPGGGSGGFVEAIIESPSSTYGYSVGTGGAGGTSGFLGGDGGSGIIIVEEYYL